MKIVVTNGMLLASADADDRGRLRSEKCGKLLSVNIGSNDIIQQIILIIVICSRISKQIGRGGVVQL